MGLINPRDIADLTQLAMRLGAQTMESNKELLSKPGRPESKPISSNASPSELLGQSFTNLMNGGGMGLGGGMAGLMNDRSAPPIEKTQTIAKPVSSLPREFGAPTLFKTSPLFPATAKGVPTAAEPLPQAIGGGSELLAKSNPNPLGPGLNPAVMQQGGEGLLKLASSFLRGAGGGGGGGGGGNSYDSAPPSQGSGGYEAARGSSNGNIIPNIRQLLPGARENFGVKRGDGLLLHTFSSAAPNNPIYVY
uniref:Uncharacterized protein n=1 Tax=Panagrolaimus superbus TaxID=310955 RepID=A0A914Y3H0_9BILA